jgi:putative FmdB family regulatory protein
MPEYEYICNDCKKDFSVFLSVKDLDKETKVVCSHCKSENVKRKVSAFFAKTDSKS